MLLTKVFAEAVAFLRLFDLSALAVTNKLCSSLTVKASTKIQWEEFPDRVFLVLDRCIVFGELELTGVNLGQDCSYLFSNETGMVDFVAAAFRNCIFEDSEISFGSRPLLDAFDRVADSVIVKGALSLPTSVSPDDSLKIVRSFRKVKVSFFILPCHARLEMK